MGAPGDFAVAVEAVVDAFAAAGYAVEVTQRRYPDRRFTAYAVDPVDIKAMRERFAQWRGQLLADLA